MSSVSRRACALSRASLIALGFSIPISAAVDEFLTAVIVLSWLVAVRFRETAQMVRDNPVASIACLWFAAHALGALYSVGESPDVVRGVLKSATFLLVPIAVTMLVSAKEREWALHALMWAIGLTAVLSTLRWLGVLPDDLPFLKKTDFSSSVVFKFHLTQNLLVAFGAFLFAVQARRARTNRLRFAWAAAAAFAAVNVLVMGDGRIGQVVLVVLLVYLACSFRSTRAFVIGTAVIAAAGAVAYVVPDSTLNKRSSEAFSEASAWNEGVRTMKPTSIGNRLDYYRASAAIVAKHPFLGVGTGGFPAAYAQEIAGTTLAPTTNPHSEYLLRAVELGVGGIVLVLALFVVVWRQARRLATSSDTVVARGLVIAFAVTGFASTPLLDHTEMLLFAWLTGVLFAGYRPSHPDRAHGTALAPARPGVSGSA